jgi:phage-related protein
MKSRALVWLAGEIKTPPFSAESRRHAGLLLREVQEGELLTMPDSRPMSSVGARVHELRINDPENKVTWRIIYRIDKDAIVISEVFAKKSQRTPLSVINICKRRYRSYDRITKVE